RYRLQPERRGLKRIAPEDSERRHSGAINRDCRADFTCWSGWLATRPEVICPTSRNRPFHPQAVFRTQVDQLFPEGLGKAAGDVEVDHLLLHHVQRNRVMAEAGHDTGALGQRRRLQIQRALLGQEAPDRWSRHANDAAGVAKVRDSDCRMRTSKRIQSCGQVTLPLIRGNQQPAVRALPEQARGPGYLCPVELGELKIEEVTYHPTQSVAIFRVAGQQEHGESATLLQGHGSMTRTGGAMEPRSIDRGESGETIRHGGAFLPDRRTVETPPRP